MKKSSSHTQPRHFRTIWLLLVCSALYFVLFIFPNLSGAQTPDMLAIFEVDEFAQYEHAVRMASGTDNWRDSLREFVVYQHYFYGYPFYFFSALVLLPLRLLLGSGWAEHTSTIVVVLRQLINVLPNLLSVWLLTYAATEFKSSFKTISLFLLMLLLPGLTSNSLWWHADGLGLLFMALVFFFLRVDRLRFGRYFWLSALAAGIGLGIKYVGGFFVFAIPLYLLLGLARKTLTPARFVGYAAGFVALMLAAFVITNPLLLFPPRADLIATQRLQFEQTSQGILMGPSGFLQNGRLPSWLTTNFGSPLFLALLGVAMVVGWRKDGEPRLHAALLTAWLLPNLVVMLNASSWRIHYWLPIMLPAMTALVFVLPERWQDLRPGPGKARVVLQWALVAFLAWQASQFAVSSGQHYLHNLQREQTSASLRFYRSVQPLLAEQTSPLHIYRDWKVYFPAEDDMSVFMDWDLGSHDMLNSEQPDVLLLERENVEAYGDEDYLASAPDPERLEPMHSFYRAALLDDFSRYQLIYEDDFGLVFLRQ